MAEKKKTTVAKKKTKKKTTAKKTIKSAVKKTAKKAVTGAKTVKKAAVKKPGIKKSSKKKSTQRKTLKAAAVESPKKGVIDSYLEEKENAKKNETVVETTTTTVPAKKLSPTEKFLEVLTDAADDPGDDSGDKALEKTMEEEDEDINPDAIERGDDPMSIVGHLDEFRTRFLKIFATVFGFTAIGFYFANDLVKYLVLPFEEATTALKVDLDLNIFELTGGFMLQIKAAFLVAILLGIPVIIYQLWKFIIPAITKKDRWFSRISITCAVLLFYGGVAFVYFGLLPAILKILISFIPDATKGTIGANSFMSFIILFSLLMGFLFELPIISLILTRIGIITPQTLVQKRKIAIVVIWVLAAVISPPDVFSQAFVAIPIMFLYEISVVISRVIFIRQRKKELRG
ncbi:MAG: twin-arginine translocase subunit TatC [bacterium]|nr:twin-arginine translocase subunit TatC [bacterium]